MTPAQAAEGMAEALARIERHGWTREHSAQFGGFVRCKCGATGDAIESVQHADDDCPTAIARAALSAYEQAEGQGTAIDPDGPCGLCGAFTSSLAANPGMWPLRFPHPDGTGKAKPHHVKCVTARLFASPIPAAQVDNPLVTAVESFIDVAERAIANHRRPKGGMQVPYFDDFAQITPSVVGRLEWWARTFRAAIAAIAGTPGKEP